MLKSASQESNISQHITIPNMRKLSLFVVISYCLLSSCSTTQQLVYSPSNAENINAVKALLSGSTTRTLATIQNSSNEGMAGLLPDELKPVLSTLKSLGLTEEIDKLDQKVVVASTALNMQSASILEDAIYQLEMGDAAAIIRGQPNAATTLLKRVMYEAIVTRYSRTLDVALANFEELKHWDTAVTAYNLFAKNKIDGSLSELITKKAVDGLFKTMCQKEAEIRNDLTLLGNNEFVKVFEYHLKS